MSQEAQSGVYWNRPQDRGQGSFLDDLKSPTSQISEAYSALIAALRYSTEDGMPKVLALTSTRSGEGKSSSAFAIAQNYARLGRRVLLVDSDLRKPAFKTESDEVGLSQLLTTDDSLADHLVPTQFENLTLLPSGPVPPNPADLLSTGRLRKSSPRPANSSTWSDRRASTLAFRCPLLAAAPATRCSSSRLAEPVRAT